MTNVYLVSEEVLRQVLEALDAGAYIKPNTFIHEQLRTILAKGPLEPVAWEYRTYCPESDQVTERLTHDFDGTVKHDQFPIPLYALKD